MPAPLLESIRAEYLRYQALAEAAIGQLDEAELNAASAASDNSIAVIVWHLAGNLASRFTDFLTSDGEKPWRHREEEFARRSVSRAELLEKWKGGWEVLLGALASLDDEDLARTVTIRGASLKVHEALHRSLAHVAYHVGQIVYLAKAARGDGWKYLSIPPGQSDQYNAQARFERPGAHAEKLQREAAAAPGGRQA